MEILLDASAIIAVIADEPEANIVIDRTKNVTIVSPSIISCEVARTETSQGEKSPLEDIPRIKLDITTQEIVKLLQECRAGL